MAWKHKCAHSSVCRLCFVVLSVSIQKKFFTASNFSFSGHSHVGSLFTSEKQERVGSWPYITLLPYMTALSMIPLTTVTTRHKVATLMAMFLRISNIHFFNLTYRTRNWAKNLCLSKSCSIPVHTADDVSLFWFPSKQREMPTNSFLAKWRSVQHGVTCEQYTSHQNASKRNSLKNNNGTLPQPLPYDMALGALVIQATYAFKTLTLCCCVFNCMSSSPISYSLLMRT